MKTRDRTVTAVIVSFVIALFLWAPAVWSDTDQDQSDSDEKSSSNHQDAPVATKTLGAAPANTNADGDTKVPLAKGHYVGGAPHKEMSADEAARQLANPNSPLASLSLKNQWTTWSGDLPDADGHDSGTILFQPVFPFAIDKEDTIFFRPAFPYLINQPVVDPATGDVYGKSGFGDMGYDIAWGHNFASGLMTAVGMAGAIPIGASGLSNETWSIGPEILLAYFGKWGLIGLYPNYQFDISGPAEVSKTTAQTFLVFLPGGGWSVGSTGISTYDHKANQWTVPLNLMVGKTIKMGKTPVKFALQLNYYVLQADELGPEWMLEFDVTPVVKNIFAGK